MKALRIALTPGEPAGVGPDLCVMLAQEPLAAPVVVIADPGLLEQRAEQLGLPLTLVPFDTAEAEPGSLRVLPVPLTAEARCGRLDPANADYVLATLRLATEGCLNGDFDALVTGPVHKGVINDAGHTFTGHTEFLAELTQAHPVMMLVTKGLRVALVTTHLPLSEVSRQITSQRLERVISILHNDLRRHFGLTNPRILVCGLNPHAGEGGHLGREEIEIIEPTLDRLRQRGINLTGPLPADTLFTPKYLQQADTVLAMYHDQGLPVLKHLGFGKAVNVTLGLPIIRTSVDHGTALDLAGSGQAGIGSLHAAVAMAGEMVEAKRRV